MTPYLYPPHLRPLTASSVTSGEAAQAQCPTTKQTVYVLPSMNHCAEIYCHKCGKVHKVLREVDGVKLV